jgi:hypothetical protein
MPTVSVALLCTSVNVNSTGPTAAGRRRLTQKTAGSTEKRQTVIAHLTAEQRTSQPAVNPGHPRCTRGLMTAAAAVAAALGVGVGAAAAMAAALEAGVAALGAAAGTRLSSPP